MSSAQLLFTQRDLLASGKQRDIKRLRDMYPRNLKLGPPEQSMGFEGEEREREKEKKSATQALSSRLEPWTSGSVCGGALGGGVNTPRIGPTSGTGSWVIKAWSHLLLGSLTHWHIFSVPGTRPRESPPAKDYRCLLRVGDSVLSQNHRHTQHLLCSVWLLTSVTR